jgi:hypothetical protein
MRTLGVASVLCAAFACVPSTPDLTGKSCTRERGCGEGYSCVSAQCVKGDVPPDAEVLIPRGATWKYLETASQPPSTWIALGYNETGWKSGLAPLGYGNTGEVAVIGFGSDELNKYPTAYFRLTTTLHGLDGYVTFTVRVRRDDSAAVYMNGVEVYRSNLPSGPLTYSTLALASVSSPEEFTYFDAEVPAALLVEGPNQLAAEVHQRTVASNDLIFDLELVGTP